jgi:hypothetical protein
MPVEQSHAGEAVGDALMSPRAVRAPRVVRRLADLHLEPAAVLALPDHPRRPSRAASQDKGMTKGKGGS